MKYESLPRKFFRWLSDLYSFLKEEYGNWAYAIIAVLFAIIYKPLVFALNTFSLYMTYAFFAIVILGALYLLIKKIFR